LRRRRIPNPSNAPPIRAKLAGSGVSTGVPGPSPAKPVTDAPAVAVHGFVAQTKTCAAASKSALFKVNTSAALAQVPDVLVSAKFTSLTDRVKPSKRSFGALKVPKVLIFPGDWRQPPTAHKGALNPPPEGCKKANTFSVKDAALTFRLKALSPPNVNPVFAAKFTVAVLTFRPRVVTVTAPKGPNPVRPEFGASIVLVKMSAFATTGAAIVRAPIKPALAKATAIGDFLP